MVIMHMYLAKRNMFHLELRHHSEICLVEQRLPYSRRKLSNIDKITHAWYQHLWCQPTLWGTFRRKLWSVSHPARIFMGIRKAQSPASAALRRSFIAVQVCGESVPIKPEESYIKTALKNQISTQFPNSKRRTRKQHLKKSNRTILTLLSQACT